MLARRKLTAEGRQNRYDSLSKIGRVRMPVVIPTSALYSMLLTLRTPDPYA